MEAAGENIFKIIVVGPPGSGKTALVRRFVESKFTEQPAAVSRASQVTGGMEFNVRSVDLPNRANPEKKTAVKLQIYHAPGDPKFHSVTTGYFKDAHGIVVVYDVSRPDVMSQVRAWLDDFDKHGDRKKSLLFLVGNKTDARPGVGGPAGAGRPSAAEFEELLRRTGAPTFECSAKTGQNVESTFTKIASLIMEKSAAPQRFHLNSIFNKQKEIGERKSRGSASVSTVGAVSTSVAGGGVSSDEEADDGEGDEEGGVGSRITAYFKGKFKRQRRRVKQMLLQKVNATDTTDDPLYTEEKMRYVEFDKRLEQLKKKVRLMFEAFGQAFETGAGLAEDFKWFTHQSAKGVVPPVSFELMRGFSALMEDGNRTVGKLWNDLENTIMRLDANPASSGARALPAGKIADRRPATTDVAAMALRSHECHVYFIPQVKERMEHREQALLDFDAYRRKLRNVMAKSAMEQPDLAEKLKKTEAKLLRAQDTFEVINTNLIQDFIACQDYRAEHMNEEFMLLLKQAMKLFHSVSKNLDIIVPLVHRQSRSKEGGAELGSGSAGGLGPAGAEGLSASDAKLVTPSRAHQPEGGDDRKAVLGALPSTPHGAHGGAAGSALSAPAGAKPIVQFVSNEIDALFGQDEARLRAALQAKWENMRARFATFSVAHGFGKLHEIATPEAPDEALAQTIEQLKARFEASAPKKRKPPPPSAPMPEHLRQMYEAKLAQGTAAQPPPQPAAQQPPTSTATASQPAFQTEGNVPPPRPPRPAQPPPMKLRAAAAELRGETLVVEDDPTLASSFAATRVRQASKFVRPPQPPVAKHGRRSVFYQPQPGETLESLAAKAAQQLADEEKAAEAATAPDAAQPAASPPAPEPEALRPSESSMSLAADEPLAQVLDEGAFESALEQRYGRRRQESTVLQVEALYDYEPIYEGDLRFKAGDIVLVYQWTESSERAVGWWRGYANGLMGYFPASYVQPLSEPDPDGPPVEVEAASAGVAVSSGRRVPPGLAAKPAQPPPMKKA